MNKAHRQRSSIPLSRVLHAFAWWLFLVLSVFFSFLFNPIDQSIFGKFLSIVSFYVQNCVSILNTTFDGFKVLNMVNCTVAHAHAHNVCVTSMWFYVIVWLIPNLFCKFYFVLNGFAIGGYSAIDTHNAICSRQVNGRLKTKRTEGEWTVCVYVNAQFGWITISLVRDETTVCVCVFVCGFDWVWTTKMSVRGMSYTFNEYDLCLQVN